MAVRFYESMKNEEDKVNGFPRTLQPKHPAQRLIKGKFSAFLIKRFVFINISDLQIGLRVRD